MNKDNINSQVDYTTRGPYVAIRGDEQYKLKLGTISRIQFLTQMPCFIISNWVEALFKAFQRSIFETN